MFILVPFLQAFHTEDPENAVIKKAGMLPAFLRLIITSPLADGFYRIHGTAS
jgi:hypothetical protein